MTTARPQGKKAALAAQYLALRDQRVATHVADLSDEETQRFLAVALDKQVLAQPGRGRKSAAQKARDRGEEKLAAFLDRGAPWCPADDEAKELLIASLSGKSWVEKNEKEKTVLGRAIEEKEPDFAIFLAHHEPEILCERSANGWGGENWPAEQAAKSDQKDLCVALLGILQENITRLRNGYLSASLVLGGPMRHAVKNGDQDFLDALLPFWAGGVNEMNNYLRDRPLGMACEAHQWGIFLNLLNRSPADEINFCDPLGDCVGAAILRAMTARDKTAKSKEDAQNAFVQLAFRADWDAENMEFAGRKGGKSVSILLKAIETGNLEAVRLLLPKVDVNALRAVDGDPIPKNMTKRRQEAHTPLSLAIAKGKKEIFKVLLPLSADSMGKRQIEWRGEAEKFAPLDIAIQSRAWEMAVLLARELLPRGELSIEDQKVLEASAPLRDLPEDLRNFKGVFASLREAWEIRREIERAHGADAARDSDGAKAAPEKKSLRL